MSISPPIGGDISEKFPPPTHFVSPPSVPPKFGGKPMFPPPVQIWRGRTPPNTQTTKKCDQNVTLEGILCVLSPLNLGGNYIFLQFPPKLAGFSQILAPSKLEGEIFDRFPPKSLKFPPPNIPPNFPSNFLKNHRFAGFF